MTRSYIALLAAITLCLVSLTPTHTMAWSIPEGALEAQHAQQLFDKSLERLGGVEGLNKEIADLKAKGETPFVVVTLYHDDKLSPGSMKLYVAALYRLVQGSVPEDCTVSVGDRLTQMVSPGDLNVVTRVDWSGRRK